MHDNSDKLAIILVEFNTPEDTIACVESLESVLKDRCKLFVYDNSNVASELLKEKLESTILPNEYYWNNGNVGFARGCNLGLARAKEEGFEFAMLLNTDTLIVNDSPLMAFDVFDENPQIGILGLVNYFSDRPTEIWQAGKTMRKSKLGFYPVPASVNSSVTYCDYVPGSSFIVRLSLLDSVGLLDENYFAYYEEIDFCFRVKRQGFKVAYINNSKILHHVGQSSNSAIKTYLKTRNKLYFYRQVLKSKAEFLKVTGILLTKDLILVVLKQGCLKCLRHMFLGIKDFRSRFMEFKRFA